MSCVQIAAKSPDYFTYWQRAGLGILDILPPLHRGTKAIFLPSLCFRIDPLGIDRNQVG